jgi:hypothetical protein
MNLSLGDIVLIPDGRLARVRGREQEKVKVRVRRKTSNTHQFLFFSEKALQKTETPPGWMSPEGYRSYLKTTLEKMEQRSKSKK